MALKENTADDVMTGVAIREKLVQEITELRHFPGLASCTATATLPEMMMGVDDRQFGC
jgi:hypothetical protein